MQKNPLRSNPNTMPNNQTIFLVKDPKQIILVYPIFSNKLQENVLKIATW